MLKFVKKTLAAVIGMAAVLTASCAYADSFSIGNLAPTSVFFVQGQSFTASVQGNHGTGTPPASPEPVFLTSFSIDFNNPATAPLSLYIYGSAPTVGNASTGAGSIGVGTYAGGDVYNFTTPVTLTSDVKYYAVLPTSTNIFDGSGNPYSGGVDLFPNPAAPTNPLSSVGEGGGAFDIGFNATFVATPLPTSAIGGAVLLAGLGFFSAKRRFARA